MMKSILPCRNIIMLVLSLIAEIEFEIRVNRMKNE